MFLIVCISLRIKREREREREICGFQLIHICLFICGYFFGNFRDDKMRPALLYSDLFSDPKMRDFE